MTITPVTSLADLEFKVKTDKHYEQLAILGCKSITFGASRIKTYKYAIKKLYEIAEANGTSTMSNGCGFIMTYLNQNCNRIVPIQPPISAEEKQKKGKEIVNKLNKLKNVRKKSIRKIARRVV